MWFLQNFLCTGLPKRNQIESTSVSTKNIFFFLVRPVFLNESRGRILFTSEIGTVFWKEAPHWRHRMNTGAISHVQPSFIFEPDNKISNLCLTRPPPGLDALIQELSLHQLQGRRAMTEPDLWPSKEWASWKRISPTQGEFSHVNSWNGGLHRPHGSERPHYTALAPYQRRDYRADWSSNERIHQNTGQTPSSLFHRAPISHFLTGICGNKLSLLLSLPVPLPPELHFRKPVQTQEYLATCWWDSNRRQSVNRLAFYTHMTT